MTFFFFILLAVFIATVVAPLASGIGERLAKGGPPDESLKQLAEELERTEQRLADAERRLQLAEERLDFQEKLLSPPRNEQR